MRRADSLANFMCRMSTNSGSRNLLDPSVPIQTSIRITLILRLLARLLCTIAVGFSGCFYEYLIF